LVSSSEHPDLPQHPHRWEILAAAACVAIALYTAVLPLYRAFFLLEVSYNEGWNVYNAQIVAHHLLLYGAPYGWTTVNYPALSFFLIGQLSRLTHDFLFTGRALSLLGLAASGVIVGLIVRRLTGSRFSAFLAGIYCVALFCCSNANFHVGADDPQLLAQAILAAGLLLYIWRRESDIALAGAAFLFVLGLNIKHNQIDFPLAVLIDLCLISWRRARNFVVLLVVFAAAAFLATVEFGGRYFLAQLFAPRLYSPMGALRNASDYYPPLLIPVVIAIVVAFKARRNQHTRVISLLFLVSLVLGLGLGGGVGVSYNIYFSNTVAIAILLGIFLGELRKLQHPSPFGRLFCRAGAPLLLFLWLLIPMQCNEILGLDKDLREVHAAHSRFGAQVAFLRAQPGPALCESLLRCYVAGKPYVYDPAVSTSLIRTGRLEANPIVERIRRREYGAIQFDRPPSASGQPASTPDRFVEEILSAAAEYYSVALVNKDCTIYVPRKP